MQKQIRIFLVLFWGLLCLFMWGGLNDGQDWDGDFSSYIMQAESIVQRRPQQFIEANRFTIEESTRPVGPVAYPWGLPLLLAPIYAVYGFNIPALKSVSVAFYLFFLCILWYGFRQYHSIFWRIVLICLFALNPYMLKFLNHIASDIPFLFFSTLSVLLIKKVVVQKNYIVSKLGDNFLLGSAISAAFLVRTNGILLLATLGITQLIVAFQNVYEQQSKHAQRINIKNYILANNCLRARKLALNGFPYLTFVILMLLCYSFLPEGGSSHVAHLNKLSLGLIKSHILYYFKLPARFFASLPSDFGNIVYGTTIPLAIFGIFRRYRFDYPIIIYAIITVLLYICWPSVQSIRFIFPVLPFYFSFVITAIEDRDGFYKGKESLAFKTICILPVLVVLLCFGIQSIRDTLDNYNRGRESISGPFVETSQNMFSYIKNSTEESAKVIFFKPRVMRLMTGRKSLMIDTVNDLSRGDYLCLYLRNDAYNQVDGNIINILLENKILNLIYENLDFKVYKINFSNKK